MWPSELRRGGDQWHTRWRQCRVPPPPPARQRQGVSLKLFQNVSASSGFLAAAGVRNRRQWIKINLVCILYIQKKLLIISNKFGQRKGNRKLSSFVLIHHLFISYFDETVRSWSWRSRWWLRAARCWPFSCKEKCITFKSTQIQSRLGSGQYCTWLIVLVWIASIAAVTVTEAAGDL